MNPLKRWEASVQEIDRRVQDKRLASVYTEKLLKLMDEWEASGFTTEAYVKVRDHVRQRPKLRFWPVINLKFKSEDWQVHLERCQEELRK